MISDDDLIPLMAAIIYAGAVADGHNPDPADMIRIAHQIVDAYDMHALKKMGLPVKET